MLPRPEPTSLVSSIFQGPCSGPGVLPYIFHASFSEATRFSVGSVVNRNRNESCTKNNNVPDSSKTDVSRRVDSSTSFVTSSACRDDCHYSETRAIRDPVTFSETQPGASEEDQGGSQNRTLNVLQANKGSKIKKAKLLQRLQGRTKRRVSEAYTAERVAFFHALDVALSATDFWFVLHFPCGRRAGTQF